MKSVHRFRSLSEVPGQALAMCLSMSACAVQGCGKTVEILALILSNPAPASVTGAHPVAGIIPGRYAAKEN